MTRAPMIALAASLLLAVPAFAQNSGAGSPQPTPNRRALAAGYRALTTCSAVFTALEAGATRSLNSIETGELVGIYPELQPLIGGMKAEIGDAEVSVAWDEAMPPRLAQFTPGKGCVIQPVGFVGGMREITRVERRRDAPELSAGSPTGDAARLGAVVDSAFEGDAGTRPVTTGVVVLQDGKVVAEKYADGFGPNTPQRTWSVAKSLAGTIIGAAVLRGEIDPDAPAPIANWRVAGDPRGAITVDALMRMASGLTSDTAGNRTDALYFGGTSVDEQAPSWPLITAPMSRFRYANNDTLLAVLAVEPGFAVHPPHELFDRLGMTRTFAETDWRGHYILSSQVWTTARDLARFGQLYVQDGVWEGERILPEGWRARVTTPSGPQPPTGAFGYGATFWLLNRSEGVPTDAFAAFGNRGQYVVIIPSRNVVIVRRGEDPAGRSFDVAAFTRDVLAALDAS